MSEVTTDLVEPSGDRRPTAAPVGLSARRRFLRRLRTNRGAVIALGFVLFLLIVAIIGPAIVPYPPNQQHLSEALAGPFANGHLLGTDELGRDTLSRLIAGTRVALQAAALAVSIALVVGVVPGLVAGYFGGALDMIVMRTTDALQSFPPLILAIAIAGILGPNLRNAMTAVGIVFAPNFVRIVRGSVLEIREETFVEASRSIGTPTARIIRTRILPSALAAAARADLAGCRLRAARRGQPQLPRPRRAAAAGVVGPDARARLQQLLQATLVDRLAGHRHRLHRAVVQRHRRRVARRDRSGATRPLMSPLTSAASSEAVLAVDGLTVDLLTDERWSTVVRDVSFEVGERETVGIVGESGSGKTITSMAVMGLLPRRTGRITAGSITLGGVDLRALSNDQLEDMRGARISMIFQEPMTSLNPAYTVGDQIAETIRRHEGLSRSRSRARAVEMLSRVHIPNAARRARSYPHEFSGGMRQRVMIAMALCCNPSLLIADEPTTALDVTVQAQVLELLKEMQRELGMAILFITHDLGVVADVCDRVVVMYAGQLVEQAPVEDVFLRPSHPYTDGLLRSVPSGSAGRHELYSIAGQPPMVGAFPSGCRFHPRCEHAVDACRSGESGDVPLRPVTRTQQSRCLRVGELHLGAPTAPEVLA
ncbi:MAG: dipeptide/oligopeptide/nickel ABC transporter permease/ATP-binding protein [Ilumatobacteraceae bacterium]